MKKILSVALCLVLIFSAIPVFAISASAETSTKPLYGIGLEVSSTNPTTPEKWTLSNSQCVATTGITLHANYTNNLNKATYNEPFTLTKGFELTFNGYLNGTRNAAGQPGKNFLGAKVGNITAAIRVVDTKDALVMVIAVDGTVVATSDVIYDSNDPVWTRDTAAANIEYFLDTYYMGNSAFVLSYDPATKTVTYSLTVGSTEEGTLTYVDDADAIDLSEAVLEFQSQGAWNTHAYYKSIKLEGATCTEHVYDNACDRDCNKCGTFRSAPHDYDNACDRDCNVCGAVREASNHIYTNACDRDCNICGTFRRAPHDYDNACDDTCDNCGTERDVPDHVYDNVCDGICNVCGFVRGHYTHQYDNACDDECNKCGTGRSVPDHVYDNACDTDCNECGDIREVLDHVYSGVCDSDCNECGYVRQVNDHKYSNACDIDCNVCGFVRTVPHVFTDECDGECDLCYDTRKTPHKYDGACDNECNLCG